MTTSAIATLYTFALRQGTEQSFLSDDFTKDLHNIRDNRQAFEFIRVYGSHYLNRAKMGARFQENIYFSEEATAQEMSSAKEQANSNAFGVEASVSGGYAGVSVGVSASHKQESSSGSKSSNSSSSHSSKSVSKGGLRQFG